MLLGAASLALLALIVVNIQLGKTEKSTYSNVSLQEIEAMSTEFTFNGQNWNDNWHVYNVLGQKWTPLLDGCSMEFDNVPLIVDGVLIGLVKGTLYGQQVACVTGNGNCWNGTDCIFNN